MNSYSAKYYEDGVINAVLSYPDDHSHIFNRLSPDHFEKGGLNSKVFAILLRIYNETKPNTVSLQAVVSEICSLLTKENQDWFFWINHLTKDAPLPVDIDFYISRVIKNYHRRRIFEITNAAEKKLNKGESAEDVSAYTKRELDALSSGSMPSGGAVCFLDIAIDCIETLQESNYDNLTGIKTGFIDLDKRIIGFRPGDFVILAGRPSMGKTTLGTNIAIKACKDGYKCLFFSLEMNQLRLGLRMISQETGHNLYDLSTGKITDYTKITSISDTLKNLYIDFSTNLTANEIHNRIREFSESTRIDFIVLDYLQKIRYASKERRDLEIGDAALLFKNIAKEYQCPFILLSQLSRANEKDGGKNVREPRLSDLRESGALEEHADIVIFIHREEIYKPNDLKFRNKASILIAKNRDGETGKIELTFRKPVNRFENYTE